VHWSGKHSIGTAWSAHFRAFPPALVTAMHAIDSASPQGHQDLSLGRANKRSREPRWLHQAAHKSQQQAAPTRDLVAHLQGPASSRRDGEASRHQPPHPLCFPWITPTGAIISASSPIAVHRRCRIALTVELVCFAWRWQPLGVATLNQRHR